MYVCMSMVYTCSKYVFESQYVYTLYALYSRTYVVVYTCSKYVFVCQICEYILRVWCTHVVNMYFYVSMRMHHTHDIRAHMYRVAKMHTMP